MARRPSPLRDFIYDNLLYLLLAPLALALLLAEQEIGLSLSRRIQEPSAGLTLGLATQRAIALLLLIYSLRRLWLGQRR
jgi:hypothetical protein